MSTECATLSVMLPGALYSVGALLVVGIQLQYGWPAAALTVLTGVVSALAQRAQDRGDERAKRSEHG